MKELLTLEIRDYQIAVDKTDQGKSLQAPERQTVAIYGLIGEIGSVLSEIKKHILKENHSTKSININSSLSEELGDIVWYIVNLCNIKGLNFETDVLMRNLERIKNYESERNKAPAPLFDAILNPENEGVANELSRFRPGQHLNFADYQRISGLTARAQGIELAEICIAWLLRHSAQLQRSRLPDSEVIRMGGASLRPLADLLGDIMWHVAALASVFDLSVEDIVAQNALKTDFRHDRQPGNLTALHDEACPVEGQRFPRKFSIAFITRGDGRARMYFNNRPLGDDLTDNAIEEDGYRFHDVMHLSNVAILGWSPVMRRLMGIKRKYDQNLDEVQDGARAAIVEEAVVKIIHSEGCRLALERGGEISGQNRSRLFGEEDEISFTFLKMIGNQVRGLEVEKNKYWEWEDTIRKGYDVFSQLENAGQGTVLVDMENREITFDADVNIDVPGLVVGQGIDIISKIDIKTELDKNKDEFFERYFSAKEIEEISASADVVKITTGKVAAKEAVRKAIAKEDDIPFDPKEIEIRRNPNGKPRAVLYGDTLIAARRNGVINLQLSISHSDQWTVANAIAMTEI